MEAHASSPKFVSICISFMVHFACSLNALYICACYRSGNCMKSFDVVNVLSQLNVCREVQVEGKKCHFQWSSRCTITNISKCISWWVVHTSSPSPTPLTSFCPLSLSTHVTIDRWQADRLTGDRLKHWEGKKKWSWCRRGRRGQTICESHYHILTCMNYFITCSHTVVKEMRTVCNEEHIALPELRQTDRRHLNSNPGYISPVPRGQEYYSPSKEIVWQLEAMEGHRVYLELSQIDLHNKDGNCSDYIEISFNPCTPPMKICDNRVNSYAWPTS